MKSPTRKQPASGSISRRQILASSTAAAASLALGPVSPLHAQDIRLARPSRIVETSTGRVQGVVLDGNVNAFYGIPYAASTAGRQRFMPPQPAMPWTGVRETTLVADRSPQTYGGPIPEVYALDRREPMSEECLNLNVFTPDPGTGRRPVMLWLHGGGYTSGSGNWMLYDGARLARSQDVVVVPVTHRLNVFGFLQLAEIGGDRFAESTNVGMLDIVEALKWVNANIERFGGDPDNVTIFGQSGGAGKVSTLMGMPPAQGLFHRAIAMSGANLQANTPQMATETAERFMSALGLRTGANSVEAMQRLPMEQLRATFDSTPGLQLAPVLDEATLPNGPFTPTAPAMSSSVPMMLSHTEHEVNFFPFTPLDEMDNAALLSQLSQDLNADANTAREIVDIYREGRPDSSNVDLYQIIASDNRFGASVTTEAERKADQNGADVFMYYFRWPSPVSEGKLKAYHCVDIPFAFNNVETTTSMTGSGQDRYLLASRTSAAFASFARDGNPNHADLPDWPVFDTNRRATMVLDNECGVLDDPFGAERVALNRLRGTLSA